MSRGSTDSDDDVKHRREKENDGSNTPFMFSIDRFDGVKATRRAMTGTDGDSSSSLSVSSSHQPLWRERLRAEGLSSLLRSARPLELRLRTELMELQVMAVAIELSSSSSDQVLI